MQIVIDIYEDEYERALKRKELFDEVELTRFEKLLVDGIPLPKEHGRLIDASRLMNTAIHSFHLPDRYGDRRGYRERDKQYHGDIVNAPTIIESNKNPIKC